MELEQLPQSVNPMETNLTLSDSTALFGVGQRYSPQSVLIPAVDVMRAVCE
jgi:hypothetical protein